MIGKRHPHTPLPPAGHSPCLRGRVGNPHSFRKEKATPQLLP